jgi:hypothetical protein
VFEDLGFRKQEIGENSMTECDRGGRIEEFLKISQNT